MSSQTERSARTRGHAAALFTILIWGTTFISTKVLLRDFLPIEILFIRFAIGTLALFAVRPERLTGTTWRQELTFAAAGALGVCLYYLLENISLTMTSASNAGVIVSIAPLITALLVKLISRGREPIGARFATGFAVALVGVALVSFTGQTMEVNPTGDLLALAAAGVWAGYSLLSNVIGSFGLPTVLTTRRTFLYGLAFMLPALPVMGFSPEPARLLDVIPLANLLFLGLGASAACFVTWNIATRELGAKRTSAYIYLVPVVTLAASALILHETLTPLTVLGALLAIAGLALSD